MRVLLVLGGAFLGFAIASGSVELLGVALGAFVGFVVAEIFSARARLREIEAHLIEVQRRAASAPAAQPASARFEPEPATRAEPVPDSHAPVAEPSAADWRTAAAELDTPRQPAARPAPATLITPPPPPADTELPVVRFLREYFTGGNTLVRVGVIILFIGMAFLLRYVAEHTHVPIEFRLSGVAMAGVVLLVLGWRLRTKRAGYALALQGGAIGILYLTVFSALRMFHVLPPGLAFVLLIVISAFCAALAVLQNSMAFALLAIGCGFLSPVMASTGEGNHVVLFSYYLILNLGILAIAWFKAWRPLNVVGFLFTFVIGTAWGVLRYRPELFGTTEPFLIAFFILYVAVAVLFSLRQPPELRGYVDGTMVFGVPIVAFGLQSALVHDRPFFMAYSALAVSAMYLVLAWLLHRGKRDTQRMLVEAFMALGVVFATLAVPLALDGRWSAATWAMEGAALVWVGCRQGRRLPRAFGALLQIAGGFIFLFDTHPYSPTPILNSAFLGGVMVAIASVFACHTLQRARERLKEYELPLGPILFFWGLLWWLGSGSAEIDRQVQDQYVAVAILIFLSATALLSYALHWRLAISVAKLPPLALLPAMVMFAALSAFNQDHPLEDGAWVAWPIAFASFYFLLRRIEIGAAFYHAISALLLVALVSWEFAWQIDQAVKGGGSWPAIVWALVPAFALLVLPGLARRLAWPVGAFEETYVAVVGGAIASYLILWSVGTNLTMRGDPFPLPYVPILNPLDLAQAFVVLALIRFALHLDRARYPLLASIEAPQMVWTLALLVFIWLNAILLRTLHHWQGVPYEPEILFRSTLVQTSLTIFWTVLALATMLFATRSLKRLVWIVGASLMAVVIAKLFLIDLSRVGTVERIVSFVGVGVLMLVVGYFSPLPPARRAATA